MYGYLVEPDLVFAGYNRVTFGEERVDNTDEGTEHIQTLYLTFEWTCIPATQTV